MFARTCNRERTHEHAHTQARTRNTAIVRGISLTPIVFSLGDHTSVNIFGAKQWQVTGPRAYARTQTRPRTRTRTDKHVHTHMRKGDTSIVRGIRLKLIVCPPGRHKNVIIFGSRKHRSVCIACTRAWKRKRAHGHVKTRAHTQTRARIHTQTRALQC